MEAPTTAPTIQVVGRGFKPSLPPRRVSPPWEWVNWSYPFLCAFRLCSPFANGSLCASGDDLECRFGAFQPWCKIVLPDKTEYKPGEIAVYPILWPLAFFLALLSNTTFVFINVVYVLACSAWTLVKFLSGAPICACAYLAESAWRAWLIHRNKDSNDGDCIEKNPV